MEEYIINETDDNTFDSKIEKARAIVIDENNMIYVCNMNGSYVLPGGTVEIGEEIDITIIRELEEELGIFNCNPIPFKKVYYYHEGFPKYQHNGFEKRLNIVNYYILNISSDMIGSTKFTDYEKKQNIKIELYTLEELSLLLQQSVSDNKWKIFTDKELSVILEIFKQRY